MSYTEKIQGFVIHRGALGVEERQALIRDCFGVIRAAPLVRLVFTRSTIGWYQSIQVFLPPQLAESVILTRVSALIWPSIRTMKLCCRG